MASSEFFHTVLIVDDEKNIGKSIGRILQLNDIAFVYVDSAQKALEQTSSSQNPFSLIISDHKMPYMTGTELLEQVREASPDTVRFLLTAYADMETIISSVNRGAVHRYILKPWDNDKLLEAVISGLKQYKENRENLKLFMKAKDQHRKLHLLKQKLTELTSRQYMTIMEQNRQIDEISAKLKSGYADLEADPEELIKAVEENLIKSESRDNINTIEDKNAFIEQLNQLYAFSLNMIYEDFENLAKRSGFIMPYPFNNSVNKSG